MRRNMIGFFVALYMFNGGVFAPPRVIAADTHQEVVSALDALLRAASTCDAAAYARVTAPDVTLTRWDGVFMTQRERLKEMRESCKPGPVAQTSDTIVRTYGDVVIVTNRVTSSTASKPRRDTRASPNAGRVACGCDAGHRNRERKIARAVG